MFSGFSILDLKGSFSEESEGINHNLESINYLLNTLIITDRSSKKNLRGILIVFWLFN